MKLPVARRLLARLLDARHQHRLRPLAPVRRGRTSWNGSRNTPPPRPPLPSTAPAIPEPGASAKEFTFPAAGRTDNAFHVYGVLWAKDKLQFYRDDPSKPFSTLTPANLPPGAAWVFNHPFFLLLNFAIGSSGFAGATNPSTPETGAVLVDYVRVYQAEQP